MHIKCIVYKASHTLASLLYIHMKNKATHLEYFVTLRFVVSISSVRMVTLAVL